MRYAPVMAFDETKSKWHVIGVFAQNVYGVAIVRINERDQLVVSTPAYKAIEPVYNKEFEDGEVTYYDRPPRESSSIVVRLRTDDPQFLEKYGEQLERQRKFVRLGEVKAIESENITEHIEALLQEVIQDGIRSQAAVGG